MPILIMSLEPHLHIGYTKYIFENMEIFSLTNPHKFDILYSLHIFLLINHENLYVRLKLAQLLKTFYTINLLLLILLLR